METDWTKLQNKINELIALVENLTIVENQKSPDVSKSEMLNRMMAELNKLNTDVNTPFENISRGEIDHAIFELEYSNLKKRIIKSLLRDKLIAEEDKERFYPKPTPEEELEALKGVLEFSDESNQFKLFDLNEEQRKEIENRIKALEELISH